ncbi:MAG: hypothetical protein D3906_00530 [Candidatus Electrothrix sp. AUS1_2]|nr:hypothetical protein [Candidatus Electrothrix sp. AUS1_2]
MAQRVIAGVPGSGKTYYAVWHLAEHYFKKDDETGVYELVRDCTIITNIDGFQPDHIDLKSEIDKAGDIARNSIEAYYSEREQFLSSAEKARSRTEMQRKIDAIDPVAEFFSYEYQEAYKDGKPQIVYVIDEVQRFFRKGADKILKAKKVFDYFEYHRHWGQDIYLVTQNINKLPSDITTLCEYSVNARARVRAIGRGFRYDWIASGEVIKTEALSPDPAVFSLYKSMDVAESEKIRNPLLKTIGLMFLAAFFVCFGGYLYFSRYMDRGDSPVPQSVVQPSSSSLSSSGGAYIPVGTPRKEPEHPRYVVFVPLSSITRLSRDGKRVEYLYVWRGSLIPNSSFPHKTLYMAGQRYAVLDYELFEFMFDSDDRPRDFIVQVAVPSSAGSEGSGADERSRAQRLERSERSETVPRTERPLKKLCSLFYFYFSGIIMSHPLEKTLGRCFTARQVADYLQCDISTVYRHYSELGGVKLGKTYKFFEQGLVNALLQQATREVARSGQTRREEIPQIVQYQVGSETLGDRKTGCSPITGQSTGGDPHNIFG